ncbi:MAG: hypothetical protein IT545_11100, partial [Rhodobacteraceae bacterium]|nr:hypothetical protein [Paracoccaceae bacterium]
MVQVEGAMAGSGVVAAVARGVVLGLGVGLLAGAAAAADRGDWTAAARYRAGDVVTHAGSAWEAVAESRGRPPAAGAGVWRVLAAEGAEAPGLWNHRGAWNVAERYVANDVVEREGSGWLALRNSTGRDPAR